MNHASHPDDERLAALAGGDPDVTGDATLSAHVAACDRCRSTVDEISLLRSALAELPDLVPSRPFQLLPPVAEAPVARRSWVRRLFAPVVATGAGLVLVGAVGSAGLFDGAFGRLRTEEFQGAATYDSQKSPGPAASDAVAPGVGTEETQPPVENGAEFSATPSRRAALDSADPSTDEVGGSRNVTPSPASFAGGEDDLGTSGTDRTPWVVLLFAGAALTGGAFLLRGSPARAG